jgi:hypothetical protein
MWGSLSHGHGVTVQPVFYTELQIVHDHGRLPQIQSLRQISKNAFEKSY